MRPKRFADGAAMPFAELARAAARGATGCDGTRRPTLAWPPVTASETCAARGTISVSGPGQNAAASARASSGIDATIARAARCPRHARSPDGPPAVPSPRRFAAPRRDCRRPRRARRPSRWGMRRACHRAATAPRARSTRDRRARRRRSCGRAVGAARSPRAASARIHAFTPRARAAPRMQPAKRSGNERFPVHVGIGVGRPPGQGRGPDFRRGARRDSRA